MLPPDPLFRHISGLPRDAEGAPVFAEPWQAQVFAMTVHLNERGVFSWSEWAEVFSAELYQPGRCVDGSDYFEAWAVALSRLLSELSITSERELDQLTHRWQAAALATPHGQPIRLT